MTYGTIEYGSTDVHGSGLGLILVLDYHFEYGHSGSTSAHIYILSQPVNKASAGNSYFFVQKDNWLV